MCVACQIDTNKAEAFSGKLIGALNSAAMVQMISIGHRSGLFDTMAGLPAATSEEVAQAAGLNERYVREWLGAMTTSGVVECEPDGPRFRLPQEHAAFVTRAAGADNMAVFTRWGR